MSGWHSVIETEQFLRCAKAIMSDDERQEIVAFLAAHPNAGVSLGGGLRKVRVARPGAGKSGGYRTIHIFVNDVTPVILLTVFAKNVQGNLSGSDLVAMRAAGRELVAHYGGRL